MVDAVSGVVPLDLEIAAMLRKGGQPVILAVNKADGPRQEMAAVDFYALGLGEPLAVSAHHGRGAAELLDCIVAALPKPTAATTVPDWTTTAPSCSGVSCPNTVRMRDVERFAFRRVPVSRTFFNPTRRAKTTRHPRRLPASISIALIIESS